MKAGALTHQALNLIKTTGQPALRQACKNILTNHYDQGVVCEALHYYATEVLPRILPIFPTLIQLSAQTAGATPANTEPIAASMLLITASGDIHDDIIDNS
ncbi:MAG TPA: hypothetical protein VLH35_01450, partial [Candidatus Acidoferrales bacterium]|nr:hypothetical protein [Candidatus Acidoferrales bacterium]